VTLLVLSLGSGVFLFYSALRHKENTREQYAFRCLATISTLVTLAITSVSSRQGLSDEVMALLSAALGHPVPEAPPAPFSEKALIVLLVAVAIYVIYKSHGKWAGAVSSDEVDRRRMKRTTSLVSQAIDESIRLARNRPHRKIYAEEPRIDPVAIPGEPNLVWYDHARELFELTYRNASFQGAGSSGWDQHSRCWIGEDRVRKTKLLLFCVAEKPNKNELRKFHAHATIVSGARQVDIYAIYRDVNGAYCAGGETCEEDDIRMFSEEYLYKNLVDFSDYFTEISRRVEDDPFSGTNTTIRDIYTPSSVSSDALAHNVVSEDLGDYLSHWATQPAGRQIAILGEYGQGKSTGALMFAYDAVKSALVSSGGRTPILIELRGKSPANLSPQELLAAWAQQYKLQSSALMKLLIAGRLILIFEGFDEMANVASAEARVSHFRSLWRFAYPKSKIVFTGRRNLFFEDRELQIVFRGAAPDAPAALCEVLHLCPFDSKKIEDSIRWIDKGTSQEIMAAAQLSPQILDIVARPALLYIVATLWQELRPLLSQGKITSAQVIDRFIQHSYERQEAKEPDLNFMALTTTERRYFHEGLAVYMTSRDATNQITGSDLRAAIERFYKAYPDDVNISDSVVIETERRPLKKRIPNHNDAIETILTDVRTHGILVNDLGQRGAFRFAHKSFYELLAAKAHAFGLLDVDPLFYRSIRAGMDGAFGHSEKSPEILGFFAELLTIHLRANAASNDIAIPAFDLIMGLTATKLLRRPIRTLQFSALRFLHNRRWKIGFFGIGSVILALSAFAGTQTGKDAMTHILNFCGAGPRCKGIARA
jgi:hypothetical protein